MLSSTWTLHSMCDLWIAEDAMSERRCVLCVSQGNDISSPLICQVNLQKLSCSDILLLEFTIPTAGSVVFVDAFRVQASPIDVLLF